MLLDVDDLTRYVVARWARVEDPQDRRTRATRRQVKAFVDAVLRDAVRDRVAAYGGRARGVARRLSAEPLDAPPAAGHVALPGERQQSLW